MSMPRICPTCGCRTLSRTKPAGLLTRADGEAPAIERRYSTLGEVSVDETVRTFEGYAVRFGQMNDHREFFQPGAFRATLAKPPTGRKASFYLQHDWNQVIGEWVELREDDIGLFVKGRFVKSVIGEHAMALVREKLVTGLSIGFVPDDYEVENADDWQKRITHHKSVDLYEVSLVERPSDKTAGVTAVRTIRADMTRREIEDLLRSQGATRAAARDMASKWRPKDDARDAPDQVEAELRDAAADAAKRADAKAFTRLLELMRR